LDREDVAALVASVVEQVFAEGDTGRGDDD
jgi:hypothetical protein